MIIKKYQILTVEKRLLVSCISELQLLDKLENPILTTCGEIYYDTIV